MSKTSPPARPWPLSMSGEQRELVSILADIVIPREGNKPSASEVNVTNVIDEWVSAPYPSFQSDRLEILSGLVWLDEESMRRFDKKLVQASPQQRLQIIDDIAGNYAAWAAWSITNEPLVRLDSDPGARPYLHGFDTCDLCLFAGRFCGSFEHSILQWVAVLAWLTH